METNHKSRDAGCYRMPTSSRKLQKEVNQLLMLIAGLLMCAYLTACGTWEVKFGVSEYNGSSETRTFKQEDRKK